LRRFFHRVRAPASPPPDDFWRIPAFFFFFLSFLRAPSFFPRPISADGLPCVSFTFFSAETEPWLALFIEKTRTFRRRLSVPVYLFLCEIPQRSRRPFFFFLFSFSALAVSTGRVFTLAKPTVPLFVCFVPDWCRTFFSDERDGHPFQTGGMLSGLFPRRDARRHFFSRHSLLLIGPTPVTRFLVPRPCLFAMPASFPPFHSPRYLVTSAPDDPPSLYSWLTSTAPPPPPLAGLDGPPRTLFSSQGARLFFRQCSRRGPSLPSARHHPFFRRRRNRLTRIFPLDGFSSRNMLITVS